MKKPFLITLVCGVWIYSFAQPEVPKMNMADSSEKWVITPAKNLKGELGQLDMNFPSGLDWNIGNLSITRQADKKYITSFSGVALRTKKSYNIAPGEYLIHLNNIPEKNIPIQKGHVTRLKFGFLKVISEGRWEIYDESKEKYLTSYNKPLKFAMPVGIYHLYIGGQYYPVVIKEGKTFQEGQEQSMTEAIITDPIEAIPELLDPPVIETDPITDIINLPDETDNYIVKPGGNIPNGKGRLYINFEFSPMEKQLLFSGETYNVQPECTLLIDTASGYGYEFHVQELPIDLTPSIYWISFATLRFRIPIHKGDKTRLKAGFLKVTVNHPWRLYRLPFPGSYIYNQTFSTSTLNRIFALAPGQYILKVIENPNATINPIYDVTIKDGGIVINGKKRD